jgi:hypothetical protein
MIISYCVIDTHKILNITIGKDENWRQCNGNGT